MSRKGAQFSHKALTAHRVVLECTALSILIALLITICSAKLEHWVCKEALFQPGGGGARL